MKTITYTCDKCEKKIPDVVYSLTCYANDVDQVEEGRVSQEAGMQNVTQNHSPTLRRHLCRECKDKITDGVFIV